MVAICVVVACGSPRRHAQAGLGLRWWVVVSAGALSLGVAVGIGLSTVAPVRDSLVGSLLAFLSAGSLIAGTVLGVLAGMLWVLQVTESDTDPYGEQT